LPRSQCKHQLATLLAEATGRMERVRVSDKDLGELLRGFRLQTQTHSQADRGAAGRPS
jgi:predicted nucleic acid-binding Zn finger protein